MVKPGMLRLILASLVVFHHMFYHIYGNRFVGTFAVNCFFILSGYWITVIFEKTYSNKSLLVFYISRFWRLLPVFYIFSILGAIIMYSTNTLHFPDLVSSQNNGSRLILRTIFILKNTIILGYNLSPDRILGPAWSLDIEMQFYLIFPLLFWLMQKYEKILLGIAIMSFIAYLIPAHIVNNTVVVYIYMFIIGMLLYKYKFSISKKIEVLGIVLFAAMYVFEYSTNYSHILILPSCVIGMILLFPLVSNSVKIKSGKLDRFFGEMSYLIYFSHWIWLPFYISIGIILYLLVTILSSLIVYYLIDRTSEKLRHSWVKRQPSIYIPSQKASLHS
jgi:peptidoglycan/LPS O-acetylase OafA/YrhL